MYIREKLRIFVDHLRYGNFILPSILRVQYASPYMRTDSQYTITCICCNMLT